ncbi:MAG: hypothetical protein CVU96_04385 [Firmicutes bacterium HGW-Firmicutes-20]|jgi:hypothetical protein|nr:MAG: hypothetical protein CVU96_04385 [Firmicutes bacterium HGW-Firmicutes-20]
MAEKFAEIHGWMFNKIKLQNQFSDEILKRITNQDQATYIKNHLEEFFPFPNGNLEEIIDHENIHQWLEKHLVLTDRKLAWMVNEVKGNPLSLESLEEIFFKLGKNHRDMLQPVWLKPSYVYRTLTDALTEGMPCDKANQVISHDENHLLWEVGNCMHTKSWQNENADIEDFYKLRDSWIQGLLNDSEFTYHNLHPRYKIQRK